MKQCRCGCGESIPDVTKWRHRPIWKKGHNRRGAGFDADALLRIGRASSKRNSGKGNPMWGKKRPEQTGPLNPSWAGDNVGYDSLHRWVKNNWPNPISVTCSICKLKKKLELCNISKWHNPLTYTRDFGNWFWACHSCHIIYDQKGRKRDPITGRFVPAQ